MRAVLCHGPERPLELREIEPPVAKLGEVIVQINTAGLNFYDTLIVAGKYQVQPPLPFSPGGEFAGHLSDGSRVMGYCVYGAAAGQIAIAADKLVTIPEGVSDETAAGLAVAYGTALHALDDRGGLRPGETLAVLGAAGGTGQAAIEIGKLLGARVIACASSPEKLAFCRSIGADEVIDYSREDLKEALRRLTGGRGVDVLFDAVGGALAGSALRAMAWGGRYLVIGFASGEIPKIPLNLVLLKGCDLRGVYWGAFVEKEPARHRAGLARLLGWAVAGQIAPRIHQRYELGQITEALAAIAGREVMGKAVVRVAEPGLRET